MDPRSIPYNVPCLIRLRNDERMPFDRWDLFFVNEKCYVGQAEGQASLSVAWLNRDLRFLVVARSIRALAFGYLRIVLPIYLSRLGYSVVQIGVLLSLETAIAYLLTIPMTALADRYGRRLILMLSGGFLALYGVVFASTTDYFLLLLGTAIGAGAAQGGAFSGIEQALVADKSRLASRTKVYSAFEVCFGACFSLGAFLAGLPDALHESFGLGSEESYRLLFLSLALIGGANTLLIARVGETRATSKRVSLLPRRSVGKVARFSVWGLLDGLASGFVNPFYSYFLFVLFGVSTGAIGFLLGVRELLAIIGVFTAPFWARRLGLVRSAALSRIPVIVATALVPLSPNYLGAAILTWIGGVFATVDVPLTQSYSMSVVDEDERARTAGITLVAKRLPSAATSAPAGYLFQSVSRMLPFFLGAGLWFASAASYYVFFSRTKAPQELAAEIQ